MMGDVVPKPRIISLLRRSSPSLGSKGRVAIGFQEQAVGFTKGLTDKEKHISLSVIPPASI
jgi:hypothetical protein